MPRIDSICTFAYHLQICIMFYRVQGQSMSPCGGSPAGREPFCREGDFVVGERISFLLSHPKIGQLVLVSHPLEKGLVLLKRIIERKKEENTWLYWVEGDNASRSSDSRNFGWVPQSLLLGRAIVIHKTAHLGSGIVT